MSLAVHELRTPATVAGGYLRMLQRDPELELGDRQRRMLEEAEKSLGHMALLVNQLSELAALSAGTATIVDEAFDLFRTVEEAAADVHSNLDRGIGLRVDGSAEGARLLGDRTRLRVALTALLKAVLREQPGEALVVAERRLATFDGQSVALIVIAREVDLARAADVGRAMAAFDEFRGGLGLSLPIARLVIERLGGRVWSPFGGDADPAVRGAIVVSLPYKEPHR